MLRSSGVLLGGEGASTFVPDHSIRWISRKLQWQHRSLAQSAHQFRLRALPDALAVKLCGHRECRCDA